MPQPTVAPYGAWASPITSDLIVSATIRLGAIFADGDTIYWLESRPTEGGRCVIVRQEPDGTTTDVTPAPFSVRTRVHEYGGGEAVVHDGRVYFSNYNDQRLYQVQPGQHPQPVTQPTALRYADGVVDSDRDRIICVREDHRESVMTTNRGEPVNVLASIALRDGTQEVLVAGNDFYASPRLSLDGKRLAWLTWNHPDMPWDSAALWVADLDAQGACVNIRHVAGGPGESIFQPEWSPDGVLTFASDRTGWWNLYRWEPDNETNDEIRGLVQMEAEFGLPQWIFGLSSYAYISPSRIVCAYRLEGTDRLAILDVFNGTLSPIETPYTSISGLVATPDQVIFRGGAPRKVASLIAVNLNSGEHSVIKRSASLDLDAGYLSMPEAISYPSEKRIAHGLYYPPTNKDHIAPAGEKPPLLVFSHGGPTGATSSALSLRIQFWTSRGFAVLDVNYGGSTGYGRDYRESLKGRWGIVDVDDCANGARHLVNQGRVDGARLAIRGGSAGGYTTLSALTFRDVFQAGASHYGVSDLELLARDTHKFESRYLDGLIGPYPERRDLYLERSPIHHLASLNTPVIFFQGLEDEVVPPAQAEVMVEALREKGVPVAYLAFEGEQHGFRRAENIQKALDAELYFYGRIFGFSPADAIEPIEIMNLDPSTVPD